MTTVYLSYETKPESLPEAAITQYFGRPEIIMVNKPEQVFSHLEKNKPKEIFLYFDSIAKSIDVAEYLSRNVSGYGIPVAVFCSASDYELSALKAIEAGAQAVISISSSEQEIMLRLGALRNSLKNLENQQPGFLLENLNEGIMQIDVNKTIIYVNRRMAAMLGYETGEMIGKHLFDFVAKDSEDFLTEKVENRKLGISEQYEFEFPHSSGKKINVIVNSAPVFDKAGNFNGVVAGVLDISDKKISEKALHESALQKSALLHAMPDLMFVFSKEGLFLDSHTPSKNLLLLKNEQFINKNIKDVLPGYLADITLDAMEKLFATGEVQQYSYSANVENENYYFEARMVKYGEDKALTIVRDITKRLIAEEALSETHEMYRKMLMTVPDAVIRTDTEGTILFINDISNPLIKDLDVQTFIGKKLISFIDRRDVPRALRSTRNMFKGSQGPQEFRVKLREDIVFDSEINGNLLFDATGKPMGMVFVLRDITERKKAEAEIRESQVKYQELYTMMRLMSDTMPDMLWAKDLDKKYLFANKAICEQLLNAKDTDEPIGNTDLFFAERERDSNPNNPLWHTFGELCMDSDSITLKEMKKMQFDEFGNIKGKFIYLDVHKAPLLDRSGKLIGVVGSARDITERKKIEKALIESKQTYFDILNNVSEAIYIQNKKGNFLTINQGAVRMYGYTLEEMVGKSPADVAAPGMNDLEKLSGILHSVFETGESGRFEFWGRRRNGEVFPKEVVVSKGKYFGQDVIIAAARDITDRKLFEKQLVEARQKAEESDKMKSAFLTTISHELRTPMNGIIGFVSLLQNSANSAEEREFYLDLVNNSSQRLLNTINDVIEISKIDAGHALVKETEIKLNELIHQLYKFFKPEAQGKGLSFRLNNQIEDINLSISTDEQKLEAILSNLLKNAIKFTHEGHIEFDIDRNGDMLIFRISDTGVGIPESRKKLIYERFVQADQTITRPYEGAGLGLSIARAYAGMLHGSISFESTEDIGSTFVLNIPLTKPSQAASEPALEQTTTTPQATSKNKAILVVEDDETSFLMLEVLLAQSKYFIIHAKTGNEAVAMFRQHPNISLILMDIKLPGMDGLQATEEIRKLNTRVPIIAQTAFAFATDRQSALRSGCNDYMAKPIDGEMLIKKIKQYIDLFG